MSHTVRTTSASIVIESDGIDPRFGPSCTYAGAWVGKVSIPKEELTTFKEETGITVFKWSPDGLGEYSGTAGELFAIIASRDSFAPKGARRYGCYRLS